jgi:hypothetical protein
VDGDKRGTMGLGRWLEKGTIEVRGTAERRNGGIQDSEIEGIRPKTSEWDSIRGDDDSDQAAVLFSSGALTAHVGKGVASRGSPASPRVGMMQ